MKIFLITIIINPLYVKFIDEFPCLIVTLSFVIICSHINVDNKKSRHIFCKDPLKTLVKNYDLLV